MTVIVTPVATRLQRLIGAVDRGWDRIVGVADASGALRQTFQWRRHAIAAAAIAGYAWFDAARRALDQSLRAVHPHDLPGYGANVLHGGQAAANRALDAWRRGSIEFDEFLLWDGRHIAAMHTIVELLLVPFSTVVLYGVLRYLRRQVDEAGPAMGRPKPYRAVLRLATLAVVVYFLLGVYDQVVELVIIARDHAGGFTSTTLWFGSLVRRLSLAATLLPIVVVALALGRAVWHPVDRLRTAGSAYRVLVALAVVHFALLELSVPAEQSRDAIRLWGQSPSLAVWGIVATSCFSLALAVIGLRLSTLRRPGGRILSPRGTWALVMIGGALVLAGVALHTWASWGNGVTALGLILIAVGVLSLPILAVDASAVRPVGEPSPQVRLMIPALLAMAPLVALSRAIVAAGTPDRIAGSRSPWLLVTSLLVAVLAVVGYLLARWYGGWATKRAASLERQLLRTSAFMSITLALGTLALAVVIVPVVLDPWARAPQRGVHGLLGGFLVMATVTFGALGYVIEGRAVPAALDFIGLRRIPVVTALVAWGLVGNALPDDHYHEVRVLAGQPAAPSGVTVQQAFESWVADQLADARPIDDPLAPRTVPGRPLVFVAAAGGGIRAATFTASVLDCLFTDVDPRVCAGDEGFPADSWSAVFAASGASGGSVGIASLTAERLLGRPNPDWVRERLGADLLSAELSWQLYVEAPNTLLAFNPRLERAEVLERTWEDRFESPAADPGATAYFSLRRPGEWAGPLLFLNGTNLPDGCRVTISSVRSTDGGSGRDIAAPGASTADDCRRRRIDDPESTLDQTVARHLADYLCPDEDIRLSTAAFLSARFPLVSPSGTVRDLLERRPDCAVGETGDLSIGDGGYRDNTGAAALADTWAELEPLVAEYNRTHDHCVVPFLVEIDNGHRNRGATSAPDAAIQAAAPLQGALSVFASRDAGPIEALSAEFARELDPTMFVTVKGAVDAPRVARLSLFEHPGVLAPLGWSLSRAAVDDLAGQLDEVQENRDAVADVGRWLEPGAVSCTFPAPGETPGSG
jgi:hypothetical protein